MQTLNGEALTKFVLENFNQQSSGHFTHLWSTCTEGERIILLSILMPNQAKSGGKAQPTKENLVQIRSRASQELPALSRRGLLEEQKDGFRLFSAAFGQWILQEVLAASGDDGTAADAEAALRSQPENLKSLLTALPRFKKKYWPILIELCRGLSPQIDPLVLLDPSQWLAQQS
jgi:hypothetical protein